MPGAKLFSRYSHRRAWFRAIDRSYVLLAVLLLLAAIFYLQNLTTFFMYDDEGSYAYAAWRISLGEVPYRDFLTPQMPGFLYWGGLLVWLFGRSFVALRVFSMLATLGAACLFYATNRQVFGPPVALAAAGLFLIGQNVFHNARYYRPEAYMLLLNLAGLYCLVLSERREQRRYLWLAGVLFAAAIAFKLFAALTLAGCYLYLFYATWRGRRPLGGLLRQCLALGLPVFVIVGVMALYFQHLTSHFIAAVIEHHTMQGAGMPLGGRVLKALRFFFDYVRCQPVLVLLVGWGAAALRREKPLSLLFSCQLPTVLSFFVLSRSLMTRHLTYLEPTLATLIALALIRLVQGRWRLQLLQRPWHYQMLALMLTCLALWRGTKIAAADASQRDIEPLKLGTLIQQLTSPDEAVMADYPGINFAAGRRTTYWAAGLSGGAAESGQIRGAALIEELERDNVSMVIINTRYGAHQMVEMVDYADLRRYVQAHFALIDKYHCAYQDLELYARADTMPLQPNINYQDQVLLSGTRLSSQEVVAGSMLAIDMRWQVLAPIAHDYHVSLRLVDASGRLWAQLDEPMVEEFSHQEEGVNGDIMDTFLPSQWSIHQVVLQEHEFDVPSSLPAGSYYLVAKVYDLESGYALTSRAAQGVQLPGGDTAIATLQLRPAAEAPGVEALPIEERLATRVTPALELLGCGSLATHTKAGGNLGVTLYWQACGPVEEDLWLEFCLLREGLVKQRWREPVSAGVAMTAWPPGEVRLGGYLLSLDDALEGGQYTLEVQASDEGGQALGEPVVLTGGLMVKAKADRASALAAIQTPLGDVRFGRGVQLLGYDLESATVEPGGVVELTLYWECVSTVGKDFKVFTHLLDDDQAIQGQRDAIPDGGDAPTSEWQVGEIVVDQYEIPLNTEVSSGKLAVAVGLYDPLTGARLPVVKAGESTGEDRLLLPTLVTVG